MSDCPCRSGLPYAECCGRYIDGDEQPTTAEALMRARYTAHTRADLDFIVRTHDPASRDDIDHEATRRWAERAQWLGLEVVRSVAGGPEDTAGIVEFVAHFRERGERQRHHELASFRRDDEGRWMFVNGRAPEPAPARRTGSRVGRNDPCPCGSGRKYKKCCGAAT